MKLAGKICLPPLNELWVWLVILLAYTTLAYCSTGQNDSIRLGVFKTYGDELRLMGVNISIYNEKTSRLFCFSSKTVSSILLSPPPPPPPLPLLIQCAAALLTHTSGEGRTAITIRVLWEVYARLSMVGFSRLHCPSLWGEAGRERVEKGGKRGH